MQVIRTQKNRFNKLSHIGFVAILFVLSAIFTLPSSTTAFTYNLGLIFTANPSTISSGSASTLSWEAYYIDVLPSPEPYITCTASGAWSGSKVISGSQSTGSLTSSKTYTLTCVSQAGPTITKSVTVTAGSQPPAPTLSIIASASPSSGTAPLNDVDITGNVSGTATGNIVYKMDCTNNGTWEHTSASITTDPYTVANLCDYSSAGTYTVKVQATRQGLTASDTATVTVGQVVPEIVPNPTLSNSCGIDIALVLDSSGSINSTELGQMKNAFKSFVNIFLPATPTLFSVTDFDTTAKVVQTFTDDISLLNIAIDEPISGGATNWEDGLKKAFTTFDPRSGADHPNLIVFASDGNPTVNNQSSATTGTTDGNDLVNAITTANTIKTAGTRIITIGIGDNLNTENLEAISSTDAVYTSNFSTLAADLAEIAGELCGGTITVNKLVDQDGNLATTDDQFPASGWEFDINGDPTDPSSEFTGPDGFTESVEVEAGTYSVTEIQEEDFKLIGAQCTIGNESVGSLVENSVTGISVGASDIVTCTFINHDNHIPVITLNIPNPDNILVNDGPYVDPGFLATDLEDGDLTGDVVVGGDVVDTTTPGTYFITYNVVDSDGAAAVQKTRVVTVSDNPAECGDGLDNDGDGFIDFPEDSGCDSLDDNDENTPPVITAEALLVLTLGSTFDPLAHATVEDVEDDPEPTLIVGGDIVDTSTIGDYSVTYDATDSDGATAVQKIMLVQVRAQCSDTVDNDGDQFIDSADPGCHTDADSDNLDSYDPNDNDETNPADVCANLDGIQLTVPNGLISVDGNCVPPSPPTPQCSDSIDNDEDQFIDSADPGCHSDGDPDNPDSYEPNDDDETDPTDICANLEGIQLNVPEGLVQDGDNCVAPQPDVVSVNLTANPETIDKGQNSTLSWTSENAITCEAGWTSATSTAGSQVVSPESTTVYSLTCGNGTASSTATATVNIETPSSGGGGGGGGGSGRSGGNAPVVGVVLSASISPNSCFYLRDYMRRDFDNDPLEVLKLQAFLINFEGHSNVSLTGVFDQATFDAVSEFQMKYFKDILEPWGHTGPTGYVYITTMKKINEIYCQRLFPLNEAQINEIIAFRQLLESLRNQGINPELPPSWLETIDDLDISTTTIPVVPIVGVEEPDKGQNLGALAAVIFAPPGTSIEIFKCLYELILILVVLYILGSVLKNVLYKDLPENIRKRFVAKWITIDIGLIIAIVIAYIYEWWCLIFPLFVALLLALLWTLTYNKHNSMRASVKSWYIVILARTKSILKGKETPKVSAKKEGTPEVIIIGPKKK